MRLRAGSTAEKPDFAIRQLTRGDLYDADWTRWIARRGCASASGSHARGLGAGYSAGRSACLWPRCSPRTQAVRPVTFLTTFVRESVGGGSCYWPARAPGTLVWVAAVSPTFGRLFEGTDELSLGQTWSAATNPTRSFAETSVLERSRCDTVREQATGTPQITLKKPIGMQQNGWQPDGKLLASGNAVSE
jgi:hypothetical protein